MNEDIRSEIETNTVRDTVAKHNSKGCHPQGRKKTNKQKCARHNNKWCHQLGRKNKNQNLKENNVRDKTTRGAINWVVKIHS